MAESKVGLTEFQRSVKKKTYERIGLALADLRSENSQ
jgi:hypothetical protein